MNTTCVFLAHSLTWNHYTTISHLQRNALGGLPVFRRQVFLLLPHLFGECRQRLIQNRVARGRHAVHFDRRRRVRRLQLRVRPHGLHHRELRGVCACVCVCACADGRCVRWIHTASQARQESDAIYGKQGNAESRCLACGNNAHNHSIMLGTCALSKQFLASALTGTQFACARVRIRWGMRSSSPEDLNTATRVHCTSLLRVPMRSGASAADILCDHCRRNAVVDIVQNKKSAAATRSSRLPAEDSRLIAPLDESIQHGRCRFASFISLPLGAAREGS